MTPQADARTRDPEATVERLVSSALDVFAESGFDRATIDRIVSKAGYSKGAFYTHFKSKEEVFLFILERRLQGNLERVRRLCKMNGSASAWLVHVVHTLIDFSAENKPLRALSIEFMANGMRNPELGERIGRMHQRWRALFAETLRDSDEYRTGRMKASPDAIAHTVVAMIDGFIVQIGLEPDPMSKENLVGAITPLIDAWFKEAA